MKPFEYQRGGAWLGFILDLVVGLVVALGVAVYVTKVPMSFSSKNQTRSAQQDAVESQKNKEWNPNAALQVKPAASSTAAQLPQPEAKPAAEAKPAVQGDPLGVLARTKAMATTASDGATPSDPFIYFVQVGAYRSVAEAESQRARLAMLGFEAKVSERDQAGRSVFRVRLGPFDDKAGAQRLHAKLDNAQIENTIVRTQR